MKSQMRCKQVYEICSSEPQLIKLLDIRPIDAYAAAHIPGAVHFDEALVWNNMSEATRILHVVISLDQQFDSLALRFCHNNDYVLLDRFSNWLELGYPIEKVAHKITKEIEQMQDSIIFYQMFEAESSTYTYLLADPLSKEAILIDPVLEMMERDLQLIDELGVKLVYVLDTHIHADHITAANAIRSRLMVKTCVSLDAKVSCADILLQDGQEIKFGSKTIQAIATPGHTDSCMSFYCEGMLFTGDALLIKGCGRTDFQQGSSEKLYDSVHKKIFSYPNHTKIYPAHDYRGHTSSTVGLEKLFNPRLGMNKSKGDFVKIMSELKLANPKKMAEAVPANLTCGRKAAQRVLNTQLVDGIPEITPRELNRHLGREEVRIIDVRRPDEYNNELGHIHGSELIPLGDELSKFLLSADPDQEIVFVCRSGGRSNQATIESLQLGYTNTANLVGGMLRWNDENLPTEQN